MVGGVAGGLAEYLDVDPVLIRLLWVILLFTGVGLIAYIVAVIIIPESSGFGPVEPTASRTDNESRMSSQQVIGIILMLLGLLFLVRNFVPGVVFIRFRKFFWPAALIVCGIALIVNSTRKE